jgi:hypothetical protein
VIDTNYIGSCKSNYHTTAPVVRHKLLNLLLIWKEIFYSVVLNVQMNLKEWSFRTPIDKTTKKFKRSNLCLSPLMLWVRFPIRSKCTTSCDKVCQWLATGWWFSPGPPVSSTNKTKPNYVRWMYLLYIYQPAFRLCWTFIFRLTQITKFDVFVYNIGFIGCDYHVLLRLEIMIDLFCVWLRLTWTVVLNVGVGEL